MESEAIFDVDKILEDSIEVVFPEELPLSSGSQSTLAKVSMQIVNEACYELEQDECIPRDIVSQVNNADREALVSSLKFLDGCLVPKRKFPNAAKEKVYANFHQSLSEHRNNLHNLLSSHAAAFLCLRVVDILTRKNYSHSERETSAPRDISKKETDIVVYIGGYVIRSLIRKARRITNVEEREGMLKCLEQLTVTSSNSQESQNNTLTRVLDRGGLINVHPNVSTAFLQMERIFRSHFSENENQLCFISFQKVCEESENMCSCLFDQMYGASEKLMEKILYGVMRSYFTVRANHECKTFMDNHRRETKTFKKSKGLRKLLKE